MGVGLNIKQILRDRGMTIKELSIKAGVSLNTLYSITKRDSARVDSVILQRIADALEVSIEYLTGFLPSNILPLPKMKKVPLLGTIACGEPILAEENIEGFLAMPENVGADFCLRCKGDSMINARIFDGDIVYIRQQPQVEDGEIAAVMVGDDEATLKRVHLFPDHIVLEPENPQYRAKSFWDADMSNVRILGKAVAFVSNVR